MIMTDKWRSFFGESWSDALARAGRIGCLAVLVTALGGCGEESVQRAVIAEPYPVGGPPLVRRLTESQYRATVADIFGADIPVTARFERGVRSEGLIAVGTSRAGFSPFSIEQYHVAARGVAAEVVSAKHRDTLLPCLPEPHMFDESCVSAFLTQYGPLLLRRALSPDEVEGYVEIAREGFLRLGDFYSGLEHLLVGLMVSPEFLYRVERVDAATLDAGIQELDSYSKASRLSFFLTNASPDRELLRAAEAGELETREGLARQVDRLLASPRFEETVRAFFEDMLEFDLFEDLSKDSTIYPAFNSEVAEDAREQTLRTIVHHLLDEQGDYRDLFTTRDAFLTRALGVVYRVPVPTRDGWEHSRFPEYTERAGIQSHISFLALHSHPGRSSPTLRGTALREVFLCQIVPDPPPDVDFSAVDFDTANVSMPTARDRLKRHNEEPACAGCHLITDPPALTLEKFDGLGAHRTHENGVLIDTTGSLDGIDFDSPQGLAQALHDHPETPRCLVEKLYRYAVGRDTVWQERAYMDWLIKNFSLSNYQVPELMRTMALSNNFFAIQTTDEPQSDQYSAIRADQEDRI